MKKIFTSVLFTILCCSFSFSLDWGGVVTNNTIFSTLNFDNVDLQQSNDVSVWLSTPLGSSGFTFSGELLLKYNMTITKTVPNTFEPIVDCDLLKISGSKPIGDSNLLMEFGRFRISDITSVVFNQLCDGANFVFSFPLFNMRTYAGYTGLLNGLNTTIISEYAVPYSNIYNFYSTAYPLLVLDASFDFPYLIPAGDLKFEYIYFGETKNFAYNRMYCNVLLKGMIGEKAEYKVASVLEVMNTEKIANFSEVEVTFPINDNSYIACGAEYASGLNGPLVPFSTVSSRTQIKSFIYPETTGSIIPNVNYVYLKDDLLLKLDLKLDMNCIDSFEFCGVQLDSVFLYNLFTDLQIGLDGTVYFSTGSEEDDNIALTLYAALAF